MSAITGSNVFEHLLNNDEQHSKKPQEKAGPGKPDKSDQRRSQPKQHQAGAGNPEGSAHKTRVDDRDRRGGRGGSTRGGGRGGRGGYHGVESDGVHRNFDRKQGEHSKHAPGEARKHGAVGEADPTHFQGSAEEFNAQDAAATADANGDIVGDMILDIMPPPADPDDSKLTLDEYLAQRNRPEDDLNRQTREVTNEGDFRPAKPFKKQEEGIFGEPLSSKEEQEEKSGGAGGKKKKNKISLDEFVGERPAPASSSSTSRGGRGGSDAGSRGGRGGFDGAARGGRGGFQGDSGSRGGRGGFDGQRGGGRGGRGGFDNQRGGRGGARAPAANVNLADQSAFPALSPK